MKKLPFFALLSILSLCSTLSFGEDDSENSYDPIKIAKSAYLNDPHIKTRPDFAGINPQTYFIRRVSSIGAPTDIVFVSALFHDDQGSYSDLSATVSVYKKEGEISTRVRPVEVKAFGEIGKSQESTVIGAFQNDKNIKSSFPDEKFTWVGSPVAIAIYEASSADGEVSDYVVFQKVQKRENEKQGVIIAKVFTTPTEISVSRAWLKPFH